jgi:hypothetical protein
MEGTILKTIFIEQYEKVKLDKPNFQGTAVVENFV